MKRIVKHSSSVIVVKSYQYPLDRELIIEQLEIEQNHFCAYTEEFFCPGYARDIEHFDPSLKNTTADGYKNWFGASSRINRKKGSVRRWSLHQPILDPTDADLEKRLVYVDGYYIPADSTDTAAKNLRDYLILNGFGLPNARRTYINTLKDILIILQNDKEALKQFLINHRNQIQYRRAIETELGILL